MKVDISDLIAFIIKAEKLKTELRHSWLSDSNRQESVAEHSWMLSLIAMTIFDSLDIEIDRLKVLKMVIIHDLAEAVTGDIPTFEISERQTNKFENEKAAFIKITEDLPANIAQEYLELWLELEAKQTVEAKLAQCLDKIEVLIQHTIADISTWDSGDYEVGIYNRDEYFDFHPFLREFKNKVIQNFWQKMEKEDTLKYVKQSDLERHKNDSVIE